jgi:hypothetical protein
LVERAASVNDWLNAFADVAFRHLSSARETVQGSRRRRLPDLRAAMNFQLNRAIGTKKPGPFVIVATIHDWHGRPCAPCRPRRTRPASTSRSISL